MFLQWRSSVLLLLLICPLAVTANPPDVTVSSEVSTTVSVTTTTKSDNEGEKSGILMPVWALVLHIFIDLLLIAGIGFVFWWGWKNRKPISDKTVPKLEGGNVKKPVTKDKTDKNKTEKETSKSSRSSKKSRTTKKRGNSKKSSRSRKTDRSEKSSSEVQKSSNSSKEHKNKSDNEMEYTEKSGRTEKSEKSGFSEKEVVFGDADTRSPPKEGNEAADHNPMRSENLVALAAKELPPPPERSETSKKMEPVTSKEFEYYLSKIVKIATEYYDDPTPFNVTTKEKPGFLYKKFPRAAPDAPEKFQSLIDFFNSSIFPGMTHWQHPRFFAYYPAGRCYPDMLAELLIASLGVVGFSWDSCPAVTETEHAMVNWVGRALGIPESHLFQAEPSESIGGGAFFESASEAVYCSMLAARQWKISQLMGKEGGTVVEDRVHYDMENIHKHCQKLVFYTSKDAHSAMEKGCKMALVRCRPIQPTAENNWGITGEQLEKEILKDIAHGLVPTYVYVTIGTTSTAASDNLESIWPIANKYNVYIHVDAAYAGMFWIDPRYRCRGLEHVWSINANMHKTLLHSPTATIFFCKDKKLHMDAFAITPIFLKATHKNAIDYRDWGVNLSRRFKGLKTWFILGMYGLNGLRDYVNKLADNAQYFMTLVAKHPNCRVFGGCNFGLFCFQYVETGMTEEQISEATTALCRFMNESNKAFFTHTRVSTYNLIRVSINYERCTRTTCDESWSVIQDLIEEFKQNRVAIVKKQLELPTQSPLPGRRRIPMPGDDDISLVGSANLTALTAISGTNCDISSLAA